MNFFKNGLLYNSLERALYLSGKKYLKILAKLLGVNSKSPRKVKEKRNILNT